MIEPIIHPASRTRISAYMAHLPQSFLLSGPQGIGLGTVALWVADTQLAGKIQPRTTKGEIDPQGTISVEAVRDLYKQTRGKKNRRQVYIIDDADRMSAGAQAAFLKLLEEPAPHTHFLLTSHHPEKLLSTITSRVQHLQMLPITPQQTAELIQMNGITDATKQAQLQFIAAGLPAEITRLIRDEAAFAARAKIATDARTLLSGNPYSKLLIAQQYQSDRAGALQLVSTALHILRRTISANADAAITARLQTLLAIHDKIAAQHNIRLQLASFVV